MAFLSLRLFDLKRLPDQDGRRPFLQSRNKIQAARSCGEEVVGLGEGSRARMGT